MGKKNKEYAGILKASHLLKKETQLNKRATSPGQLSIKLEWPPVGLSAITLFSKES